ncbi:SDR family NAD(P)-dependent oxidoreductase [Pseudoprimorskyibacter insulae]|uniref:C-factor n=1 Tax=Pseudoprimorskyibacter insulae TaxID=1695997 RepID=A0A2R8AQ00_9RHOB|nr:SDR family NAD(P)-dependent oxidoreductase [Pseudoprimorskyibacter insulae]SPF77949.1 C-factor [Pseudoprimorskyibacter insulae]
MRALVIGSTGGIGAALVTALTSRGAEVTGLSRRGDGLDITDASAISRRFAALSPGYDLIFTATGALEVNGAAPEKALSALTPKAMADQFAVNAIGPMMVLQQAQPLLARDRRAVIATLSARVGSIGDNRLGGWHSYRMAKAALNQGIRGAAIELARTHKQAICVALHPGTVETEFTRKYLGRHPAVPPAEAAENLLRVIAGLTPGDTGQFYDWAGKRVPW